MEQQEQVEWNDLNKLLQHHGFKPVYLADPVQNKNLSDLVLLDGRSAAELRATLRTMLTDSERRQTLIHQLAKSNSQLKEEVQEHMRRAVQQSQRAAKMEQVLDQVKTRVQDLEDRCLTKAVQQHTQDLQHDKLEADKLCETLQQKLSKQMEEKAQLQRKLYFAIKEEESRLARQSRTFHNICKDIGRRSSAADQRLLDIIDFYETKLSQLLDELRSVRVESDKSDTKQTTSSSITPSFRAILKTHQEKTQQENKAQIQQLNREVESLRQELETRQPQHKGLPDTGWQNDDRTPEHLSDTHFSAHYHHLLTEISILVTGPNAPLQLHGHKPSVGVELDGFQKLVPTLEVWAQQLNLLKELQQGLDKLNVRMTSWRPPDSAPSSAGGVKVEDMMLLVASLLESTCTDDDKMPRTPTRFTLASMVSHFQKLFDVTSLSGVYPRMTEVYTRLGEMTTAMRNLRDILDLDSRVPPAAVVKLVSSLVSSTNHSAGLHDVLGDADIDSIIVKVKQHEEFFPAFHSLATEMLQTLGVSRLDDVLPALMSLKEAAQ